MFVERCFVQAWMGASNMQSPTHRSADVVKRLWSISVVTWYALQRRFVAEGPSWEVRDEIHSLGVRCAMRDMKVVP